MNQHITVAPPEVTVLLEEIRADASLNASQRNELIALLERGDIEQAADQRQVKTRAKYVERILEVEHLVERDDAPPVLKTPCV